MNFTTSIYEWKMSQSETAAYSVAIIYHKEYLKTFRDQADGQSVRRNTLPKRGDPRKSSLFRHCWKLVRTTRGLLEFHEYPLYIKANFYILKANNAYIAPNAICGDKAWIRYKLWKRHYENKLADIAAHEGRPKVLNSKIIVEIDRTKKFLFEKCEGAPDLIKYKMFFDKGIFRFWIMSGKISQYYIACSPYVSSICDVNKLAADCSFSLDLVNEKLDNDARNYFRSEFKHEFVQNSLPDQQPQDQLLQTQ